MLKKIRHSIKGFFASEQSDILNPWEVGMPSINKEQRDYQKSVLDTQALYLQRDIANKNLKAAQRNMIIAFMGVLVALGIGIAGIFLNLHQKPPVVQVIYPKQLQAQH